MTSPYQESVETCYRFLKKHGEFHRRESSGETVPEDELIVCIQRMRNAYPDLVNPEHQEMFCGIAFDLVNNWLAEKRSKSGREQLVAFPNCGIGGFFPDLMPGVTIEDYVNHELTKVGR